ncbi:unnamed protein product [Periconia digitata]|uniref:Heterokaryon incompatibility domain-containing protein n=1 Tax=Periconia digitata TaxID=1303443 RepID=A0A9W4UKL2_9PLEO|nr:unnamed protein product [Periconia digitata]
MSSIYETLPSINSIRLLYLGPIIEGNLTYSLVVVDSYQAGPEYHALSYCWGDPHDTLNSLCNGESFSITRSLHDALSCLSRKGISQPIWADAVCMNQSDLHERNQQVSIMRQIYERAARVSIWIGRESYHDMEMAINLISRIGQAACQALHKSSISSHPNQECDRSHVVSKIIFPSLPPMKDSEWVIQEVRESQDIHFLREEENLAWDHVGMAAKWVFFARSIDIQWTRNRFESYSGFTNASFMWNQTKKTRREAPFPALLNCIRHFQATDTRDRVFALLQYPIIHIKHNEQGQDDMFQYPMFSNTAPATHLKLQADYKMTTGEVYRLVALESIQCYGNLEVLTYAWQPRSGQDLYPSWIPRWNPVNSQGHWTNLLPFLYDAAKDTTPVLQPTIQKNIISLQGLNLGCIIEKSTVLRFQDQQAYLPGEHQDIKCSLLEMSTMITQDRWQEDIDLEDAAERGSKAIEVQFADFCTYALNLMDELQQDSYLPVYSTWCNICGHDIVPSHTAILELPTQYKCYDYTSDLEMCTSCYEDGKHCPCTKRPTKTGTTTSLWLPYTAKVMEILRNHANGNGRRFLRTAMVMMRDRAFFYASHRWKSVGYQQIEPGDTIAVLFGSRVPFILRKVESEVENGYRLIGDCYIHGLMDGEAIQMWKDGDERAKLENFTLY